MTKNKEKKQLTKEEKTLKKLKRIAAIFDYHLLQYLGIMVLQRHTHIKRPYLDKNNKKYFNNPNLV